MENCGAFVILGLNNIYNFSFNVRSTVHKYLSKVHTATLKYVTLISKAKLKRKLWKGRETPVQSCEVVTGLSQ